MNNTTFSDMKDNLTGPAYVLNWTFTPIAETVTSVLSLLFNGFVLLVFSTHHQLRTPFTVYVMGTLSYNCMFAIFNNPFDVMAAIFPSWIFGMITCTFYCYTGWVLSGIVINSHMLITINRIWAITFPISYKQNHRQKTALILTACLWIYVHLLCLPGVVLDAVYYRLPVESNGCYLNTDAQRTWSLVVLFVVFDFPILFISLACPFLLCRQRNFRRIAVGKHSGVDTVSVAVELRTIITRPARVNGATNVGNLVLPNLPSKHSASKERSRSMLILTALTISILVCYTPQQIFYTILSFVQMDVPLAYTVTAMLFTLQAVLDPILFVCTLKDLRNTIKDVVCG